MARYKGIAFILMQSLKKHQRGGGGRSGEAVNDEIMQISRD